MSPDGAAPSCRDEARVLLVHRARLGLDDGIELALEALVRRLGGPDEGRVRVEEEVDLCGRVPRARASCVSKGFADGCLGRQEGRNSPSSVRCE